MVLDHGKTRKVKRPVALSCAEDVEEKEPEWLIPGYVPRYGITTLGGEGGTGKTSIICNIAAAVTTGKFPFMLGKDFPFTGEPEKVLFFSAEDPWAYVLKKRLRHNGANLELVKYLPPSDPDFVNLNLNGELLEQFISEEMCIRDRGVSRLVREHCDMTASIPMKGDIDSLNASVAAGVLAYEIVRQRLGK